MTTFLDDGAGGAFQMGRCFSATKELEPRPSHQKLAAHFRKAYCSRGNQELGSTFLIRHTARCPGLSLTRARILVGTFFRL